MINLTIDNTPFRVNEGTTVIEACKQAGVNIPTLCYLEKIQAIGRGGMSGAPITARSLEVVRYIHQKSEGKLPILAVGGIMSVEDALNMLDAGATLIQIYTGFIYQGPGLARKINRAIVKRRADSKT